MRWDNQEVMRVCFQYLVLFSQNWETNLYNAKSQHVRGWIIEVLKYFCLYLIADVALVVFQGFTESDIVLIF